MNNLRNFLKFLLQFSSCYGIIFFGHIICVCAAMAQSVERHLGKVEVTGSIPVGSLMKKWINNFNKMMALLGAPIFFTLRDIRKMITYLK